MHSLIPLVFLTAAQAEPAAAVPKAFEVISIKPNAENDNRISIRMAPGGSFSATGIPARFLIGQAFNMRDFQIIGGPSWMGNERYDVNAKGPDGMPDRVPPEMLRVMLKSMLEDRFELKYHLETRELPIYHLVQAKGGSKLVEVPAPPPGSSPAGPGQGGVRLMSGTPGAGGGGQRMMTMGRGQLSASAVPVSALANQIAQQLGRPVIDKTGLTGLYDFKLEWSPEPGHGGGGPGGPGPGPDAVAGADSTGPTIFTALQEKLGLRLESAKGPVEVVVIDSISKPSGN